MLKVKYHFFHYNTDLFLYSRNISKLGIQGPAADIQACTEAVQIAFRNGKKFNLSLAVRF